MDNSIPRTPEEYRAWWAGNTDAPYGSCWCGCGRRTNIAPRNSASQPYVKGEPYTYIRNHHVRKVFLEFVEEDHGHETPCWIWQGAPDAHGYGNKRAGGKDVKAHRFCYERERGSIPIGHHLHHLCEVRLCVNPDHLQPLTPRDHNRLRRNNKLTFEKTELIRTLRRERGITFERLATTFGVSTGLISDIITGKKWRP